jgi:tetrahydromethanopterin S-methyltransferase subunit G
VQELNEQQQHPQAGEMILSAEEVKEISELLIEITQRLDNMADMVQRLGSINSSRGEW